jgi:hypothetical protein
MRGSHCRNLPRPCQRQSTGIAKEHHRAPLGRRRRSDGFVRTCCQNAPSGEKMAPERGFTTESRTGCLLGRQMRARAATLYAITAISCLRASHARRSSTFLPRANGENSREVHADRNKKVAPCGYDYEPTFIRWVSSSPVPASPATEDPLPGRDVGLPSNACRFTQFVPQGDDKTNVGELSSRCQS